jgi:hypothetical protein
VTPNEQRKVLFVPYLDLKHIDTCTSLCRSQTPEIWKKSHEMLASKSFIYKSPNCVWMLKAWGLFFKLVTVVWHRCKIKLFDLINISATSVWCFLLVFFVVVFSLNFSLVMIYTQYVNTYSFELVLMYSSYNYKRDEKIFWYPT